MSVYDQIRDAIKNKKQVIATYNGHVRHMCPHVLGTKDGRPQALFYQFGGSSSSGLGGHGSTGNWRCLPLDGLTDVQVVDGAWQTGPNHSRPQTCVGTIDVQVTF